MGKYKLLLAGESWFFSTVETKGFDQFTVGGYDTEIERVRGVMADYAEIDHLPCHLVAREFPDNAAALAKYDAVILSDVGANTLLLHPDTFFRSNTTPNKLDAIAEYVKGGGTLIMMGGYLTFTGIDAKGNYKDTIIEEILPVDLLPYDDRREHPEGISVTLSDTPHPMVADFPKKWLPMLGYNKLLPKADAEVVVSYGEDPILALRRVGNGSTVAWASDCAPHWLSPEFCEWEYNKKLWNRVLDWAAKK